MGNKRKRQEVVAIEEGERPHAFIDKAAAILDGITDGTLMILKGHLLLEELLYAAVLYKCPNPAYLENSQLRFFQLLRLVRALYLGPPPEQTGPFNEAAFWDALDALNTPRNRLAHKLEPKDLSALLQRMLVGGLEETVSLADPKTVHAIGFALSALIGLVLGRFSAAHYIFVQRRDFP
jgi:hypothetical protein